MAACKPPPGPFWTNRAFLWRNAAMVKADVIVTNPKGVHARPSSLIVRTAIELDAAITLSYRGETVDATDIMLVLSLGASEGAVISITADGPDEEQAIARMREIFALNFYDDAH